MSVPGNRTSSVVSPELPPLQVQNFLSCQLACALSSGFWLSITLPRHSLALLCAPRRVAIMCAATALIPLRFQLAAQRVQRLEVQA